MMLAVGCGGSARPAGHAGERATLTIGIGQLEASTQLSGLSSIVSNQTIEPLIRIDRDGRFVPTLAQSLETTGDGSLRIHLRPNVKFSDGSAVTSDIIVGVLRDKLSAMLGPAAADIVGISAIDPQQIEIRQERPSSFLGESIDFDIEKPGAHDVGTGPFFVGSRSETGVELVANDRYYLGTPAIGRVVLRNYPSVRAAWADMLRGNVDALYEVGLDALDSLQASSQVAIYLYQRPYAYSIVFNTRSPDLKSADVRRALNDAIDRPRLIADGLGKHGTPADGPVWPHHWAYNDRFPAFKYDAASAQRVLGRKISFSCIFPEGPSERLALAAQHQLAQVGVDMRLQSLSLDELSRRVTKQHDFDAVLFDAHLAPNLFRSYQWWHSGGVYNFGQFQSARVDAALDAVRYARNDAEYAAGTLAFQQAFIDDPPAILLAWGERARAVSRRFDVPSEPGRDILTTLRLWKPSADPGAASRN
jgi:ABC-type transport system substrate-binding protein